jgi:uncharacterized protein (UPF0333 family)
MVKLSIDRLAVLHADQQGQATLEWVLLLAAVVLPVAYVVYPLLMNILAAHYQMVTFLETLPLP